MTIQSLYTFGNTANVSANNFTTLYNTGAGVVNPQLAYGNANVVSLLAVGTDGGNTITDISATGNIYADNIFANIVGNLTVPGNTGEVIFNNSGSANASANLTFNTATNEFSVAGNVAGNYFIGNGSQLTGLPATYSNANVATFMADFGSNVISTTGNITGGYFLGNGSQLTGLPATYGNANVAAFLPNYTGNLAGANLSLTGNAVVNYNISAAGSIEAVGNIRTTGAAGNITGADYIAANYYTGNGVYLTGITATTVGTLGNLSVTGNINTGNMLTGGLISAVGNVTGDYFIGNGSQLTGIVATSSYSNANVATFMADFGSNVVSTTGNVTAGYFVGNGSQLTGLPATYSNANVVSLMAAFGSNVVSTTGNVTAGYFVGNGSELTSIAGANVTGTVANATYAVNANAATFAGTVTTAAQPNITSVGTLTSLSSSGNITGNYIFGNGSQLTGLPDTYSNSNVTSLMAAFGSNTISTSGNITGGYILGDGSQLTGLPATYSNANVATFMADFGSNTISTSGAVTAGNITGSNVLTGGQVSAAGNVSGGNLVLPNNGKLYGDFSSAVSAGRTVIQTTGTGTTSGTYLTSIPSSTFSNASILAASVGALNSGSDPANAAIGYIGISGNDVRIASTRTNTTTTFLPINIQTSNVTRVTITTDGNVGMANSNPQDRLAVSGNVYVSGNITGDYILGNGSQLTGLPATYSNANVATFMADFGSNTISTTGNITGDYFIGNGSLLTGIATSSYGNANVATFLANFGSNTLSTSGNISAGNVIVDPTGTLYANSLSINGLTANTISSGTGVDLDLRGVNSNVHIEPANGTVLMSGNGQIVMTTVGEPITITPNNGSVSDAYLKLNNGFNGNVDIGTSFGGGFVNVYATISATGNIRGGNVVTGGQISASGNLSTNSGVSAAGNVSAQYYIGNGSLLTGIATSSYANANVATFMADFGSNVISTTGNVTAGYFIGNGSQLTGIAASYSDSNVATFLAAFGANNFSSTGTVTAGNITGSNILTGGLISATGNVTGNYILGNGSQLTGLPATYGNSDVTTLLAGFGSNTISTTGNITASYFSGNGSLLTGIVATGGVSIDNGLSNVRIASANANITMGVNGIDNIVIVSGNGVNINSSSVVGTTTTGTTGNIIISGKNIATDMAFDVTNSTSNASVVNPGRVVVGSGLYGNINATADTQSTVNFRTSRLAVWDTANVTTATSTSFNEMAVGLYTNLQANVTSGTSRIRGLGIVNQIGGGSLGNTYQVNNPFAIAGGGAQMIVGGNLTAGAATAFLGTTTVQQAVGLTGLCQVAQGNATATSNIGNAVGVLSFVGTSNQYGNMSTAIGITAYASATTTGQIGNLFAFYTPGPTNNYGMTIGNAARLSSKYYSFYVDDPYAQAQLGALRNYNHYVGNAVPSAGAVTIDKTAGQVQTVYLSANVTSVTLSNFVSSTTVSSTTQEQADKVTVYFSQDTTGGWDVTMPTGSTYKYANNVTTITTTANSVTQVDITAIRLSGTTNYLINILPGYV